MIGKRFCIGSVLCMATVFGACATDSSGEPPPQHQIELSLDPVGRFVRTDREYGYRVCAVETEDGREYIFNDKFYPPDEPIDVDCKKTEQLGAWLTPPPLQTEGRILRRNISIYSKQLRVIVQWGHSAHPEGDTHYRHGQFVHFGHRFTVRHNLTKSDKVDGIMTLQISRGDEVFYTTSFQLDGCEAGETERAS
ncbi:MAG: hypothetical protein K0U72_07520 [Gammaproteobacteria bacterium]|nr:hypothetical protein [Gammaproteobacteria bacterium]